MVLVWETKDHINEANFQLSVSFHYKKLPQNQIVTYKKLVNDRIDWFKREQSIAKKTAKRLNTKDKEVPTFYMLPKIHEISYPGRPVISCIGCHSSSISKFSSYQLQPVVKNKFSYVQDSFFFLNKVDTAKNIPDN